jgi:VWFA-related protein
VRSGLDARSRRATGRRPFGGLKPADYGCIALAAAILGLSTASSGIDAQQQRPPVFRGEAVLVTVDVYPQRDGKIVEGMTAADFQVLEDGKPQKVETVEFVRIEPSLSESTRRDPNSMREMLALVADPHVRTFVVFLDQLHVTVAGSHAIRRPMVDSLNRIIGPSDLFAVMTQNTDPRALTFGRRLISVEEQLTKYWTWGERNSMLTDPTDPMEQTLKDCFTVKPRPGAPPWMVDDNGQARVLADLLIERRREDRTMTGLERLVDRLGGMREARTVTIVITEGWRLFREDAAVREESREYGASLPQVGSSGGRLTIGDKTANSGTYTDKKVCNDELIRLTSLDDERRLRDLITRANRANVSFYPVNPAGLQVFDTPISQSSRPNLVEDGNRLRNRMDGMLTLADNTGGIAIVSTNDLAAGMRRIVDDVSAYYLLGYYSTNTTHDGRFRRIEVRAKPPGLQVRARRGYFAPSDKASRDTYTAAPAGAEPPKGLETALGEISRLRAGSDLFARGSIAGDQLSVAVEIGSARAAAAPWGNGADVQMTATLPDGTALPAAAGRIEAGTRGVLVSMPVGGTPASVRIVVKGSAGGESIEETADISRAPAGLVGDAVMYRGRPAATSPLRVVADLQYRRTERVHVEWAITGESANLDQRSARLLGRNGQPLAVPVTVTERDTDGRRVVAADLNLAPLSAGEYVIELTVGRGATTEQRLVAFRVQQ